MELVQQHKFMRLEKDGKKAWVTFSRKRYLNAMNNACTVQISRIAKALREDPDVRVIIIRGEGRAFCTGIDLKELANDRIEMDYHHRWESALRIFETMEKLVIVGLNGFCLGAACNWPWQRTSGSALPIVKSACRQSRNPLSPAWEHGACHATSDRAGLKR